MNRSTRRPRVLLDCTRTALHGGTTGVQRVVRQVARHAPVVAGELGVELIHVAWTGRRYAAIPPRLGRRPRRWVRLLKALQHRRRLRRAGGDAGAATEPIAGESAEWMPAWMERLIGLAVAAGRTVTPSAGDVLVLLDPPWNSASILDHAERTPATVVLLLHDLIPLELPLTCEAGVPGRFRRFTDRALPAADALISVSESSRRAILSHRAALGLPPCPSASFRPGSDMSGQTPVATPAVSSAAVRPALTACLLGEPTFLCVGTLEPRKNHAMLLDAFERYWSQGGTARLLIIGRIGWGGSELLQRLDRHPHRGGRLLMLNDVGDDELTYAYALAAGVVCPSLAEGFGLTIIEALAHGCRVFASDIPPHREAGGDRVVYFQPGDPSELAEALRCAVEHGGDGVDGERPPMPAQPTWHDGTRAFLTRVLELTQQATPKPTAGPA